jgi:predicted dehydrogenase
MDVAIVGCGMISDTHVQEIRKIPDARVVGVCDQEILMAEQLADRYDIPKYYSNIKEMLENCYPDVVHIITPPEAHFALSLTALEAGCHVFLEKPFTINVDEARQVIAKAKSVKRKIAVNHFHNFSPPALHLRKILSEGILGDIVHLESFYGYSLKSPVPSVLLKDKDSWLYRLPGNLLQNNISHLLYKITEFIPDENPKLVASGHCLSDKLKNNGHLPIHDELRVLIVGEKVSAYATFSANTSPLLHFMKVYGTKNTVLVDYESRTIIFDGRAKLPGSVGKVLIPCSYAKQYLIQNFSNIVRFARSDFHYYSGMNKLLRLFYNSIKDDLEIPIPYEDIIRVSGMIDEIIRQINQKEPL